MYNPERVRNEKVVADDEIVVWRKKRNQGPVFGRKKPLSWLGTCTVLDRTGLDCT